MKIKELFNDNKNLESRIKRIKNKIDKLPIGTIIIINGIKKDIEDTKIIKYLDILNKLKKKYPEENSDDELSNIFKKIKKNKYNDFELLSELGNYFINNNISDK